MECLWRRKDFKKRGGGGERIRRRWVAAASATKDINEKEIINVYISGPFLFFYFVLFSLFSSFDCERWDFRREWEGRIAWVIQQMRNAFRWGTKLNTSPPHPQKNKIQHSFSYFLSCYYCFVMMEERPMVDKQGARHRSASARHSGPYSAKSENRI